MIAMLLNNRYRILQALGSGGFGRTYLAEDTHLPSGRHCVIKRLKSLISNPETRSLLEDRFQREAALLESLGETHPQIPRLYAYFSEGDRFYLVQEWIEGTTLEEKVRELPLAPEAALDLLCNLLPVLSYIHDRGVIHRDIKPSNIILPAGDRPPVLIDFGIAKELTVVRSPEGSVPVSISVGTPGFMPPEQAAGQPVYASDLYSLGMTIRYALSGKMCGFGQGDAGELLELDHQGHTRLAMVLDQATRMHLGDRYPTAQAMLDALTAPDSSAIRTTTSNGTYLSPTLPPTVPPLTSSSPTLPLLIQNGVAPRHSKASFLPMNRQTYRNRQILLNKVRNYWIRGVLETSLHGQALIELGLADRADALERPWGLVWTVSQSQFSLPPGTRITQKFDELGEGRTLLILGEPGAGKTTTMLELAQDLLARSDADPRYPLPVIFNLATWGSARLPLADWLVEELHTKYQVSREIGREWIQQQQLLLLLDGLDEVVADRRLACVQSVNQFCQQYGQTEMVVCCRIHDYQALDGRLRFQGAVMLQPLTLPQVQRYLSQVGPHLTAVKSALETDEVLQEMVRSPLLLNLLILTYRGFTVTDLPNLSLEERRQHLFRAYTDRMFHSRGNEKRYPRAQARRWLIWLAQEMTQQSQSVFLIEWLQPDCLTQTQRWHYVIGLGVVAALCCGFGVGMTGYLISDLRVGILSGLTFGLGSGIAAIMIYWLLHHQITPVETLKWSWSKAKSSLGLGLGVGVVSGAVLGVGLATVYGPILVLNEGMFYGLSYGVLSGMCIGLVFVLLRGLMGPSIGMRTVPNQGIRQSAKNAALFGLMGEFGLGLMASIAEIPVLVGVIIGLLFGLFGAGEACVKHFTLRVVLFCHGAIPWNYSRFLDYAANLVFLQKVGGGYIFIHRLLQEHFAQLQE